MQTERGPCFGRFERWFYDEIDHACKSFTFGGCAGNENNFGTREFCEAVCVRSNRPVAKAGELMVYMSWSVGTFKNDSIHTFLHVGWLRMLLSHTSIKVKLGATARLACPAIGSPPPVIRWLKSGRELYFNK
uniref:BPTI/Kunitz inhibitor domain-containing protein n=1 Tax=Ciona savignyi TaxID=51511 RepID=H2ZQV0_CIOSA